MNDARAGTTLDRFMNGTVSLRQPKRGHRAGTDAALLAAAAPSGVVDIVDLGSGVGAAGIAAAIATPDARLTLIEIDPPTADLAQGNLELNGLAARGRVVVADAFAPAGTREAAGLAPRGADLVLTNPPFDADGKGRASPDPARRLAHVMPEGGLGHWVGAAAHLLRPRGTLVMIHRADAILAVLSAMEGRFGALMLVFVHPAAGEPASRVLVRGVLGSRAPLGVLPPLVLHDKARLRFTAEAEALHRAEARIDWEKGGVTSG